MFLRLKEKGEDSKTSAGMFKENMFFFYLGKMKIENKNQLILIK